MSQKPTIVLISGACHPPTCFSHFLPHLHDLSYPTATLQLPSFNPPNPSEATAEKDAEGLRSHFLPLVDEGKDVVVIPHSMAGLGTAGALHGLSKIARAEEGKKGGVIGAIWLSSILMPGGAVPTEQLSKSLDRINISPNTPSEGLFSLFDVKEDFYQDVPSPLADEIIATLKPHAMQGLTTPVVAPALTEPDFKGRFAYIKCTLDRAFPLSAQDQVVQAEGLEWIVRELESGHSPFASMPDKLAVAVDELVRIFVEKDVKA